MTTEAEFLATTPGHLMNGTGHDLQESGVSSNGGSGLDGCQYDTMNSSYQQALDRAGLDMENHHPQDRDAPQAGAPAQPPPASPAAMTPAPAPVATSSHSKRRGSGSTPVVVSRRAQRPSLLKSMAMSMSTRKRSVSPSTDFSVIEMSQFMTFQKEILVKLRERDEVQLNPYRTIMSRNTGHREHQADHAEMAETMLSALGRRLVETEAKLRSKTQMSKRRFRFVLVLLLIALVAVVALTIFLVRGTILSSSSTNPCTGTVFLITNWQQFQAFAELKCTSAKSVAFMNFWPVGAFTVPSPSALNAPPSLLAGRDSRRKRWQSEQGPLASTPASDQSAPTVAAALDSSTANNTLSAITASLALLETIDEDLSFINCTIPFISLPALTTCGDFYLVNSPLAYTLDLPKLVSASSLSVEFDYLLGSIDAPLLSTVSGDVTFQSLTILSSVTLPALQKVHSLYFYDCNVLQNVSLSVLATIVELVMVDCHTSSLLTSEFVFNAPKLQSLQSVSFQRVLHVKSLLMPSLERCSEIRVESVSWGRASNTLLFNSTMYYLNFPKLTSIVTLLYVANNFGLYRISLDALESCGVFQILSNVFLVRIEFGVLTTLNTAYINFNANLKTLVMNSLQTIYSVGSVMGNTALVELVLPLLSRGVLFISLNDGLESISLPALTLGSFAAVANIQLVNVSLPLLQNAAVFILNNNDMLQTVDTPSLVSINASGWIGKIPPLNLVWILVESNIIDLFNVTSQNAELVIVGEKLVAGTLSVFDNSVFSSWSRPSLAAAGNVFVEKNPELCFLNTTSLTATNVCVYGNAENCVGGPAFNNTFPLCGAASNASQPLQELQYAEYTGSLAERRAESSSRRGRRQSRARLSMTVLP